MIMPHPTLTIVASASERDRAGADGSSEGRRPFVSTTEVPGALPGRPGGADRSPDPKGATWGAGPQRRVVGALPGGRRLLARSGPQRQQRRPEVSGEAGHGGRLPGGPGGSPPGLPGPRLHPGGRSGRRRRIRSSICSIRGASGASDRAGPSTVRRRSTEPHSCRSRSS